jgi:hypothetical protein
VYIVYKIYINVTGCLNKILLFNDALSASRLLKVEWC